MSAFLGIDTSNYTTSVALYNGADIIQKKQLLPVKAGALGLRQSDAVFHHTQQLPALMKALFENQTQQVKAIGVSVKPRSAEGSYMPCFTVGNAVATSLSAVLGVPVFSFSHQQGHIAAALYGAKKTKLLQKQFLAFHVSGGTTEALLVTPNNNTLFTEQLVAQTLDLNAGQLVDRVGVMLGLTFPCGKLLEQLALNYTQPIKVKATLKDENCCLSGVENQCQTMFKANEPKEKIAAYALAYIEQTLLDMTKVLKEKYGDMPVLFSGGVMSNTRIKQNLTQKLGAFFSPSEYSADNAAGVAWLAGQVYRQ